ncbi:response regulator [bacterium]|nr:response regulator [bacterium]
MSNLKVLLVDDESEFVSTLAERLYLRGIHANTANDGEDALRAVMDDKPDLVILDIKMPGLSGIEVLKEIKKIDPQLPIILLTGHGSTKEGMEGMKYGAYDYLMKPIDINELIQKIQDAIKR